MEPSSNKRFAIVLVLLGINLIFGIRGLSKADQPQTLQGLATQANDLGIIQGALLAQNGLPSNRNNNGQPEIVSATITAYSSRLSETDETPFITASGSYVRDGIVASSFLPFGTKIKLPAFFGDKIFVVEDSMNDRYDGQKRIDIWFPDAKQAVTFGKKAAKIEIL